MIFIDQPFKLNDRIKISGFDGTIVDIGLRSTRLQTLEGRIVTIPNATFSDSPVENVTREPSRKMAQTIGLTYDMSADQMLEAMGVLRTIVESHEGTEEKVIVSFEGFGDFSMNIALTYYVAKGTDIRATQTDINMAILSAFNERSLEMAFPTQVIYTKDA